MRSQDRSSKDTEMHLALDTCFQFQIFADSSDTWIRGYNQGEISKMQTVFSIPRNWS